MDLTDIVIPKWAKYAGLVALVAGALTLTYCEGKDAGRSEVEVEVLEDNIETLNELAEANEQAANERVQDNRTIDQQEEDLNDAANHPGDDAVTSRLRTLCRELRQAGEDTENHPTCGRFEERAGPVNP